MRLKKIELQGFKSFANKTEVEFLDGITTIVGPNGSGKSNVSDAVRWVLGTQSTKELRLSKMEDVIFAGTENRKKVGFAEVAITIDNSDRSLPIDYNEVVVARRVFRSGESSYLINNSECRLKDVQELFLDTGIGKDGYSIVGQGKIDEILSNKSEDRRAIFEEASGIMKYRVKKEEATKKLATAHTNLDRVNDILAEIESNIIPLEEKARKAKEYLLLRDKLKVLDVHIFLTSVKENATKLTALDSEVETLTADIKLEEQDAINLEKAKLNLKNRLNEIITEIEEAQKQFFELENTDERLNSKLEITNSNISNANENISRLENEINDNLSNIEVIKDEIKSKKEKKDNLNKNKEKFVKELKEKEDELKDINTTLDEKDKEAESLKLETEKLNEQVMVNNMDISSKSATIEASNKQIDSIVKAGTNFIAEKDRLGFEKEDITKIVNENKSKLNVINTEIDSIKERLEFKEKELSHITDDSNNLREELLSLKSKHSYLVNLEKENEGYFKSVKSIIEYVKKDSIEGVYGTLSSLVTTDEKYEKAIEVSMGTFIQNIVVEDENKAKGLIEYLKTNLLGRATFLPLNKLNVRDDINFGKILKEDDVIDTAINLCKFDKKFTKTMLLALGNVIVVKDLECANRLFTKYKEKIRIVTLSGEIIATSGSITGGHTTAKSSGLLGRQDKIKKLEELIEVKNSKYQEIEDQISNIMPVINDIKNKLNTLEASRVDMNIMQAKVMQNLENIDEQIEKLKSSNENSITSKNNLLEEINTLKNEITILEEDNINIKEIISTKQSAIDEYSKQRKEKSQTLDFLNEDIVNLKISLSSFEESKLSIEELEDKLNNDIANFLVANVKKTSEVNTLKESIINYNNEIVKINQEKVRLEEFKLKYDEIVSKLKIDRVDISKKLDTLEIEMLASINKINKLNEEVNKINNRRIKFELDIENIKNDIWDNYELTITSANEFIKTVPEIEDTSKIIKDASSIKDEIKKLGDVDVNSIEEYKSVKERYDFIIAQKTDLDETKKKLENLIHNMTSIMKSEFSKQFKIINENFKHTFSELFGGGRAGLTLTDEENILESGIEIAAQPPGKKLGSMTLLSGGERALTATALLFAIMKIKAPPFCILDEIEAALDDINVIRFANYIKKYSDDTQFIVITHRKGTMEVANTVYGVTMEEYGISKLISMRMKEEK